MCLPCLWNSLPNQVVGLNSIVNSIDLFKAHLDNFWSCQDVMFDWTADLHHHHHHHGEDGSRP